MQHLVPEAGIEQVQHRVLHSTDVEVDATGVNGALRRSGDSALPRPIQYPR